MINTESYIISFLPGSSGRFIASMLWRMLTDFPKVNYTEYNAAHNTSPWVDSFYIENEDCNTKNIYKKIEFTKDIALVHTHTFPAFEYMGRLPTTKLIIIKIDVSDYEEVVFNWIKKNNEAEHLIDSVTAGLVYFNEHNCPDIDSMQMHHFCNPNVPKEFEDITLVINYSDIYKEVGNSYVALEQLKLFTQREVSPSITDNYKEYVDNRNELWNR